MLSLLVVLALVACAFAEYDLFTLHKQASISTYIRFNVTIDRLSNNVNMFDFTDDVVFKFSQVKLLLPIKASYNSSAYVKNQTLSTGYASTCSKTLWPGVGRASIVTHIRNTSAYIYQSSLYADQISYLGFKKPSMQVTVEAFGKPTTETNCNYNSASDKSYAKHTFDDIELCFGQGKACNYWIGEDTFGPDAGWLYFGGTSNKDYGFRVQPMWELYGARVESDITKDLYLRVREPTKDSGWVPTKTEPFPYEWNKLTLRTGSATRFYVRSSVLQSRLHVRDIFIEKNAIMLFDFVGTNNWSGDQRFSFTLIDAYYTPKADVSDELVIKTRNEPEGWTVRSHFFHWDTSKYILSVSFVMSPPPPAGSTLPPLTTTSPAPTPATAPPVVCTPPDCGDKGVCRPDPANNGVGMCVCDAGYTNVPGLGCVSNDLIGTSAPVPTTSEVLISASKVTFTDTTVTTTAPTIPPDTESSMIGDPTDPPTEDPTKTTTAGGPGGEPTTAAASALQVACSALLLALLAFM